MNKIVLEHFPASKLPDELRVGIADEASVKVTVEEETRARFSREELRQQVLLARQSISRPVSIEEAVDRIRKLRDEWDD